ncbi:lipocalin family protein, partial [Serratia sp. ME43]
MRLWSKLCVMLSALLSVACSVSPPKDIKVVNNFDSQRYLGTWYEIARLDHRFERGLQQVTAHYSPRADGGLNVINRGFNPQKQQWQESEGKAYFIGS